MNTIECHSKIINIIKSNVYACYQTNEPILKNILINPDCLNYVDDSKLQMIIGRLIQDENFVFNRDELLPFYKLSNDDLVFTKNKSRSLVEVNTSFADYFKLDEKQYIVFIKQLDLINLFEVGYLSFEFASYQRMKTKYENQIRVNCGTKYNSGILTDSLIKKPLMFYSKLDLKDLVKNDIVCIEAGQLISHDEETYKRLTASSSLKNKMSTEVKNAYLPVLIYDRGVNE